MKITRILVMGEMGDIGRKLLNRADYPIISDNNKECSRALPVCDHLRQARHTTLGESGVEKLAECNLEGGQIQCTIFI